MCGTGIEVESRAYSQLNTISRYSTSNSTLTTVIYCNQYVGSDKWSIYGISCNEFASWPSAYALDGIIDYFYLYPTGDNRAYSDVILYGVESVIDGDFILSSNFSEIEDLVKNGNYAYRGILGECSSDLDPLGDSSFIPIYEYLNIDNPSTEWHIYTTSIAEKNNYDTMPASWQDLGIICYVPNNPGLCSYDERIQIV